MVIDPYDDSRLEAVVRLSLRAWAPVFASLREAMLPAVYRAFFRDDWRKAQRRAVESACADEATQVWVALEEAKVAGFVALKLHPDEWIGGIDLIADDRDI